MRFFRLIFINAALIEILVSLWRTCLLIIHKVDDEVKFRHIAEFREFLSRSLASKRKFRFGNDGTSPKSLTYKTLPTQKSRRNFNDVEGHRGVVAERFLSIFPRMTRTGMTNVAQSQKGFK